MKKRKIHKITLKEAIERIPHDEFYCNDSGRCPYFRIRNLTRSKMLRIAKSKDWFGIPSYYYKRNCLEYCVFLQDWLYIQDGCKDCGINEDLPPERIQQEIDSDKAWHDKYEPDKPFEPLTEQEILDFNGRKKPFRARLKNMEAVDFYKEKFPDEIDLIDKIAEEDNLTYWYKDN